MVCRSDRLCCGVWFVVVSVVFPDGCEVSAELKDLILSILEKDPKKRLTPKDIRVSIHSIHSKSHVRSFQPHCRSLTSLLCLPTQTHPWVSGAVVGDATSAVLTAAVMATKEEEEQKVSPTNTS